MKNLKNTCSEMENRICIEMICNVINELSEKIEKLEKASEDKKRG